MPYEINTSCPYCGKTADGINEIEDPFGFRIMTNEEKIPQSYCRDCRSARCKSGESCKAQ